MKLIELIGTTKYDDRINQIFNSIVNTVKIITSDKVLSIPKAVADKRPEAEEYWVSKDFVPCIPSSTIGDWLKAIVEPETLERELVEEIEQNGIDETIKKTKELINGFGLNEVTYNEAVKCYKQDLYTSCVLNLFAIIDSAYLSNQDRKHNGLPKSVAHEAQNKVLFGNYEFTLIVVSVTTKIVEKIYRNANNFKNEHELQFNRNYISHGMNKLVIPDKTHCNKLFILTYNVLMLFKTGWLKLDVENNEE